MRCIDSQETGTYILVCACDADFQYFSWHICAWVCGAVGNVLNGSAIIDV